MLFAPGTPPEVIAAAEKKWLEGQQVPGGKPRLDIPAPPAPDKDRPLYEGPVRPDMPRQTLNPRQVRNQAIASAKDTRQQAMQAARAMKDSGQRLSAKQAAFDAYADARKTAQQQYKQSKLDPRTGKPRPPMHVMPIDDRPPVHFMQTPTPGRDTGGEFVLETMGKMKKGGSVKKYKAGGSVKPSKMGSVKTASPKMSSASKRGDGIAQRGKTRGKMV